MHTLLIQYITLHDIEPISILQCRHCRYFFEVNIVDITTYTMLCRRRYVDSMSINIVMHVDDVDDVNKNEGARCRHNVDL